MCKGRGAGARLCVCALAPGVGGDERDGDGHEMVVSVRILRCNDVRSRCAHRDHARCLSIAMMPRETAAPNAASGHGTTAGPTRCAAHRLPAAVTEIGHLGLVAQLRGGSGKYPAVDPPPQEEETSSFSSFEAHILERGRTQVKHGAWRGSQPEGCAGIVGRDSSLQAP
jgi:hypothetical protein